MNKLLIVTLSLTLPLSAAIAGAKPTPLTNSEIIYCESVADTGRQLVEMTYYDNPLKMSDLLEKYGDDAILNVVIRRAYRQPYKASEAGRKIQAEEYGRNVFEFCLKIKEEGR